MDKPRAHTADEATELYLQHIAAIAAYWANQTDQSILARCNGVAFSILTLFDGDTMLPSCDITVAPHPDDEQFLRDEGENWFIAGQVLNDEPLHEIWYKFERK